MFPYSFSHCFPNRNLNHAEAQTLRRPRLLLPNDPSQGSADVRGSEELNDVSGEGNKVRSSLSSVLQLRHLELA